MNSTEKDWFLDYFNHDYQTWILDQIPEHITTIQLKLIEEALELHPLDTVLDLFCGIGRHAIPLAQKNYQVTAIDLIPEYIDLIIHKAPDLTKLHPVCMDARDISYSDAFSGIYIMFTSFGYFSEMDNEKLMGQLSKALKKDGHLLIDLENRDYILKNFIHEKWRNKESGYLLERHNYNPLTSRQKTKRIWISNEGITKSYIREIRLYSAHELIAMAEKYHLVCKTIWGDYDKQSFHLHSPRMIFTFTKKD